MKSSENILKPMCQSPLGDDDHELFDTKHDNNCEKISDKLPVYTRLHEIIHCMKFSLFSLSGPISQNVISENGFYNRNIQKNDTISEYFM